MNPDHCHWCGSTAEPGEAFVLEVLYSQSHHGWHWLRMSYHAITCNACVESWEREGWRREES